MDRQSELSIIRAAYAKQTLAAFSFITSTGSIVGLRPSFGQVILMMTVSCWESWRMSPKTIEHRVSQQLLQPGVLALEALQPLGLGYLQPTVLGLSVVEDSLADPVLAVRADQRTSSRLPANGESRNRTSHAATR